MNRYFPRKKLAMLALAVPVAMGLPLQVSAQDGELEEVIITGTRVADRSAADSPVPVDVISGSDFRANASTDVQDMLRTAVPSYDVNARNCVGCTTDVTAWYAADRCTEFIEAAFSCKFNSATACFASALPNHNGDFPFTADSNQGQRCQCSHLA